MGKNKCGGNKQKAMENGNAHGSKNVQYSQHEDEVYVVVTKTLGNSTFQVSDHLGKKYIAHVRGKMKGASKRKFFIHINDILLVELRAYERECINCDVLCIFNETHYPNIKQYPELFQIIHHSSHSTNIIGNAPPFKSIAASETEADSIITDVDIDFI